MSRVIPAHPISSQCYAMSWLIGREPGPAPDDVEPSSLSTSCWELRRSLPRPFLQRLPSDLPSSDTDTSPALLHPSWHSTGRISAPVPRGPPVLSPDQLSSLPASRDSNDLF